MNDLPHDKIKAILAAMWQRNQPQILERLTLLDNAAAAATAGTLAPALREEAVSTAHKLAGTLGTFGFPEATDIARDLEQHLEQAALDGKFLTLLTLRLRATLYPQS